MRTALIGCLFLVACGGASNAPVSNAPVTNAAAPSAPSPASPASPTSASPAAKAAGAQPSMAGQWCGKPVADAKSCRGDDILFVDLKVSGGTVTGEFCEAYKKDCMPLKQSAVTNDAVSTGFEIPTKGPATANFKLNADGSVLSGEIGLPGGKSLSRQLHRIP